MMSPPQPLIDWSEDQVTQFLADYRKWSKAHPEIAKTGITRVALIYRLITDETIVPLRHQLGEVHHRLANVESTMNLLAARPKEPTCLRCGGPLQVVEYDNRRRGHVRELRCANRHSPPHYTDPRVKTEVSS